MAFILTSHTKGFVREQGSMIFKMVDKMLTTKKFKDFFNKNVAAL